MTRGRAARPFRGPQRRVLVEVDADDARYYPRTPLGDYDMDALDDPARSEALIDERTRDLVAG